MVHAIKEKLTILKQGELDIRHPQLTAGAEAEVIILIERPAPPEEAEPGRSAGRPIWEVAEEIARTVPDEVWARVPTDLSKNLDHYLYGAPKEVD